LHIQISEQIKLAPLLESDALDILNLVDSSKGDLDKFLYWVKDVKCINSARKYITERVHSGLAGSCWFKIYFKGDISGVFAVKSICPDSFVAELGYWLSGTAKGYGIINQIIAKLSEILNGSGAKAIEFRCLEQNYASIKVAMKSGAKLVDSIPNFAIANGIEQSLNIYRRQL
jgi:ribosomal-protein-serine acetyltransferase